MQAPRRFVALLGRVALVAVAGGCGGSMPGTGGDDSGARDATSSSSGSGSGSSGGSASSGRTDPGSDGGSDSPGWGSNGGADSSSGSSGGADSSSGSSGGADSSSGSSGGTDSGSGSGGDSGLVEAPEGGDSSVADAATDATGDSGADADGGPCSCSPYGPTPTCLDGSCVCARTGQRCTGNSVQTYCADNDYFSVSVPCDNQACVNGACTGVCAPGQAACVDGGLETCTANGTWQSGGGTGACTGDAGQSG